MKSSFLAHFIKYCLCIMAVPIIFFFSIGYADQSAALDASKPQDLQTSKCRKGPYLIYRGNHTSMTILWQVDEIENCTIKWGYDTSYSLGSVETTEYGKDHQHSYTITNLNPETKYYYNVIVKNTDHTGFFYSAPETSSKKVSFIVYGDTQSFPVIHNRLADSIVSTYTSDHTFQTFVLLTGDLVEYGEDESSWDEELFGPANINIRQMMRNLPFLTCVGNHEVFKKKGPKKIKINYSLFKKYFPYPFVQGTYWSFDYGPAHFMIVDQFLKYTNLKPSKKASNQMQLAWLNKDLAATEKHWKFVILHKPGWSASCYPEGHDTDHDVQQSIQLLLEKYHVTALFSGHNHIYSRALVNGVYHITTGGGGAPLHSIDFKLPKIIAAKKTYHYCKVQISNDVMAFTAEEPNGSVIDSFTLGEDR